MFYFSRRRSLWPRGLRRRSTAARLLRLWVRIPTDEWMSVCCEYCVLSGRGLCDPPITRPEESYWLWCVVVCDLETSRMRRPWPALGRSATGGSFLVGRVPRPAMVYTQPHIQLVLGALFSGVNQPKCEADIRLHLLPRLIMSGGTPPLPYMPSWGEQGQIFLLIYQICNNHKYKLCLINEDRYWKCRCWIVFSH